MWNLIASMVLALSLTTAGDYQASNAVLDQIGPTPAYFTEYCYLHGLNSFSLNDRKTAQKWLQMHEDSIQPKPRRCESLVMMMLEDMKLWDERGFVGDIGRDMTMARDRLANGKGDERTREIQKDIVEKLAALIDEAERGGKPKPGDPKNGDGTKKGQGALPGTSPAEDSKVMGGAGKGTVTDKKLREVAESWGGLPPAEREKVVAELTRELPEKYKPMLDSYFKALNKAHPIK